MKKSTWMKLAKKYSVIRPLENSEIETVQAKYWIWSEMVAATSDLLMKTEKNFSYEDFIRIAHD